jgi:hypothetical protein
VTLRGALPAGATRLSASTSSAGDTPARLDAVMIEPVVSQLVLAGHHGIAVLRSASDRVERRVVRVPGEGAARISSYDGMGRLLATHKSHRSQTVVRVVPGGFSVVVR